MSKNQNDFAKLPRGYRFSGTEPFNPSAALIVAHVTNAGRRYEELSAVLLDWETLAVVPRVAVSTEPTPDGGPHWEIVSELDPGHFLILGNW